MLHLLDQPLAGPWTRLFGWPTDNCRCWSRCGQWMSASSYQSTIYLSFLCVVHHRSMSGEYDLQFQSLRIKTCTPKLIVKTTIKQPGNFELTSGRFVRHVNMPLADWPGYKFPHLCRRLCSKSIIRVDWGLPAVYHHSTGVSTQCETLMHNVSNENNPCEYSFITET